MASRKSKREARAERLTWFAMMLVFIAVSFDDDFEIALYFVPMALGVILAFSGLYQYFREGWRVSPIVWIVCVLCLVYAGYIIYSNSPLLVDPTLFGFVATATIIGFGAFTNES